VSPPPEGAVVPSRGEAERERREEWEERRSGVVGQKDWES
jgi:hypothetical protein